MQSTDRLGGELFKNVIDHYSSITSYQDEGVVKTVPFDKEDPPYDRPFTTNYQSPNLFRFEFRYPYPFPYEQERLMQEATKYIVGSDGNQAYFYSQEHQHPGELELCVDLKDALSAAVGISQRAAWNISELLCHELGARNLLNLCNVKIVGEEVLENRLCSVIEAYDSHGKRETLYIDKELLLIRRWSREVLKTQIDEFRSNIRINESVDPTLFTNVKRG